MLATGRHDIVAHVWRFNERIRIDGEEASDATIALRLPPSMLPGDLPLTYFEFSALAALFCMAQSQVDFAILEIGLGGRLDAFNSVDADVAVITSIGLIIRHFLVTHERHRRRKGRYLARRAARGFGKICRKVSTRVVRAL